MRAIESWDTAGAAKEVKERQLMHTAAIASTMAAATYGLEVLETGIETNKRNYTRFLVVARSEDEPASPRSDKASLRFETGHEPGSLAKVLEIFACHALNLTKIQSVPILGQPSKYSFHVDLQWS